MMDSSSSTVGYLSYWLVNALSARRTFDLLESVVGPHSRWADPDPHKEGLRAVIEFEGGYLARMTAHLLAKTGVDYAPVLRGQVSVPVASDPPDLVEYYRDEVRPALATAKHHLNSHSARDVALLRSIAHVMLDLASRDVPGSDALENWLYSIGRQFVQRLACEELVSESASCTPVSPAPTSAMARPAAPKVGALAA